MRRLIDAFRQPPVRRSCTRCGSIAATAPMSISAIARQIEAGQRIVMPGTSGAELIDELKPSLGQRLEPELLLDGKLQEIGHREWLCYKPRLSAFFQTPLEDHLKSLGITTIVICGTDFSTSPRSSVYAASNRDFRIVLATDAISGATDAGLNELAQIGVYLMGSEQLLNWLKRDRQAA